MSRSGYDEDYDYDGSYPFEFYRQAVNNAIKGRRGQRFFCDLLASLDALPEKRLIADNLKRPDGQVCALGALGLARGVDLSRLDPDDAYSVGKEFGIAESLAREVVYENDESNKHRRREVACRHCLGWGDVVAKARVNAPAYVASANIGAPTAMPCPRCYGLGRLRIRIKETPEERFARMRAWVASQIRAAA